MWLIIWNIYSTHGSKTGCNQSEFSFCSGSHISWFGNFSVNMKHWETLLCFPLLSFSICPLKLRFNKKQECVKVSMLTVFTFYLWVRLHLHINADYLWSVHYRIHLIQNLWLKLINAARWNYLHVNVHVHTSNEIRESDFTLWSNQDNKWTFYIQISVFFSRRK